jgi:hypothetical protein
MANDDEFEAALEALLDGRRPREPASAPDEDSDPAGPLRILDAVARAHRLALFGEDTGPADEHVTRWGHLDIAEEIGRGATGTVYRAWDSRLSREVALKLLARDDSSRGAEALSEGRLLARLRHPHIVTVYGADMHDGIAGIWMELVRGETLDEVIDRDGKFGPEEALLCGIDLAGALAAVHAAGLLHRDVKPRNVVRERGGRLLLMDLGAGRSRDETPADGDSTGTPLYMAPELLAGGAASERSDVYSLGVLLYRLVSGTHPVSARNLEQLRTAHAEGRRTPLAARRPDLAPTVREVIERACDPDPDRRLQSAADFEQALRDALRETVTARATVRSAGARRWARWRGRIAVALGAAAAVFTTGWTAWDTGPARMARRAVNLPVPPRSPLYVSLSGGLMIIDGLTVRTVPGNTAIGFAIAVSPDLGVRTMGGWPPWTGGAVFTLGGKQVAGPRAAAEGICCFYDGTTDGQYNYSVRQDSTRLEPIGSRPLAPRQLYRFDREWANPQAMFRLTQTGLYYGVSFSARTDTFLAVRNEGGTSFIERWSRDGRLVATLIQSVPALTGLAVDPRDDTLWVLRPLNSASIIRLENYDATGRLLGQFGVRTSGIFQAAGGAEFAIAGGRP